MNINSLGIIAGTAAQLAQARITEVDRVQHETAVHEREVESNESAELAEGVGVTHEESAMGDRDADGRLPWQLNRKQQEAINENSAEESATIGTLLHAKDPSGQAGTQLDLDG